MFPDRFWTRRSFLPTDYSRCASNAVNKGTVLTRVGVWRFSATTQRQLEGDIGGKKAVVSETEVHVYASFKRARRRASGIHPRLCEQLARTCNILWHAGEWKQAHCDITRHKSQQESIHKKGVTSENYLWIEKCFPIPGAQCFSPQIPQNKSASSRYVMINPLTKLLPSEFAKFKA